LTAGTPDFRISGVSGILRIFRPDLRDFRDFNDLKYFYGFTPDFKCQGFQRFKIGLHGLQDTYF